ncbi:MAG: FtsX-like permease family protein, partial [Lachnospiraceae bacterium]|nr:FtsX-like permease family protein [Lachnospiraceae bacterium]
MRLLENNNRKFIRTLSDSCLRANRGRNAIAILAVALTAVLFMALTTVLEGTRISMKNQMFRGAGSQFMVSIKNLTQEEAERLVSDPAFTTAGIEQYVSMAVNPALSNVSAVVGWVDAVMMENSFMQLQTGHYPETADEIACDTEVLRMLGLPDDILGSTFVLEYTAGDAFKKKEMTVCGIWEGKKYEQSASLLVSKSFVEEVLADYAGEYEVLRETCYNVRGSFASDRNISMQLDRMVEKLGYDPLAERGEEGFLAHHVSPAYTSGITGNATAAYIAEGLGAVLILIAGYLIIYNIFKISIEKDIRLYGQLKTIGTSPRQIRYMVIRQGTVLSAVGIPAGLLLGWLLGNMLLPLVMTNLIVGESAFIVPPVWVWGLSGLFTWITVRISCGRPGR